MTIPTFDVFRIEASGTFWVEAAVSLEDAKARIQALQLDMPGEYFIFNQKTGARYPEQIDAGTDSTKYKPGPSEAHP